jgi:hypothetical protein
LGGKDNFVYPIWAISGMSTNIKALRRIRGYYKIVVLIDYIIYLESIHLLKLEAMAILWYNKFVK